MDQIRMNQDLMKIKQKEMGFLTHFQQRNYELIDLGMVESFQWKDLSQDDLHLMERRHKWERNGTLFALRSDWTNAIVRYRKKYQLHADKIAYVGSVYTVDSESKQMGVEIFSADVKQQFKVLEDMISFLQQELDTTLSVGVISHNMLLKKLLTKEEQEDDLVQQYIKDRNYDALGSRLGKEHLLVRVMKEAPADQADYLKKYFPELADQLKEIEQWQDRLDALGVEYVYADLLAVPMQSYYKGIFIHVYEKNTVNPIASGGQYTSSSKAFGMAITI